MPRYLIDANLPRWFSMWSGPDFVFAHDLGADWSDERLWAYAGEHQLTIVTKDADFRIRALLGVPPLRLVHVRFGNLKMRDFFTAMSCDGQKLQRCCQITA